MEVRELKNGQCLRVPLAILSDAPWGNVRKRRRDPRKYAELKESVAQRGVVQAITVRPNEENNTLEVLAGYGRRQASIDAGKDDIPVVIMKVDDREAMAIGLAENLQREDLSITDEIRLSQELVSFHDADYEEAAKALGWAVRKIRGRLKLNECSEKVLGALADGEIKIGHAEVLCQFVENVQNNTLEKIIDDGWSVEHLKERANAATRLLRHARFDTKDCEGCPYNSSVQAELFDNNFGGGKCSNLPCYREKTEAWVEARRREIEDEEGKVFLAVEKPESDRNTVSAEVVGQEAYTEECLGCVNRVRILKNGINRECGKIIDNQCIDLVCFKSKLKAKAQATEKGGGTKQRRTATDKEGAAKKAGSKASGARKITAGMTEQARAFMRQAIGEELLKSEAYRLAVMVVAMSELTGYRPKGRAITATKDAVSKLAGLSAEELKGEIRAALRYGTLEAGAMNGRFAGTDVVIEASAHVSEAKEVVIGLWSPTKEWLAAYQKGVIESFCKQKAVGFAAAYDKAKGTAAFAKLMKKKKDEIITEILDFEFDWSGIAPKEVLELVK